VVQVIVVDDLKRVVQRQQVGKRAVRHLGAQLGVVAQRRPAAGDDPGDRRADVVAPEMMQFLIVSFVAPLVVDALASQIQPHFLFNTLANVRSLIDSDPRRAGEMLETFVSFLRTSLRTCRERAVPLSQELDVVRSYLDLFSMRMGALDRNPFSASWMANWAVVFSWTSRRAPTWSMWAWVMTINGMDNPSCRTALRMVSGSAPGSCTTPAARCHSHWAAGEELCGYLPRGQPTFLMGYIRRCDPEDFGSLDYALVGAEKLHERVAQAFEDTFGIRPLGGADMSPSGYMRMSPLASAAVLNRAGTRTGVPSKVPRASSPCSR
jgi:hypothetical protein